MPPLKRQKKEILLHPYGPPEGRTAKEGKKKRRHEKAKEFENPFRYPSGHNEEHDLSELAKRETAGKIVDNMKFGRVMEKKGPTSIISDTGFVLEDEFAMFDDEDIMEDENDVLGELDPKLLDQNDIKDIMRFREKLNSTKAKDEENLMFTSMWVRMS